MWEGPGSCNLESHGNRALPAVVYAPTPAASDQWQAGLLTLATNGGPGFVARVLIGRDTDTSISPQAVYANMLVPHVAAKL